MEFALIMPVFVLLVSGIMTFGIVFAQQLSLGNAARQAARQSVVPSSPACGTGQAAGNAGTDLTGQAKSDSSTIWLNPNDVVVTIKRATTTPPSWSTGTCTGATTKACDGSAPGDNVYVRLQYTSQLNLPFMQPTFNLESTGVFRCEFTS
ncbi:TadE family protein [Pedococcus soli]